MEVTRALHAGIYQGPAGRARAAQDPYHIHGNRELQVIDWTPKRAMRLDVSVAEIEAMATGAADDGNRHRPQP